MNSPLRRTKIVATLGPASEDLQTIENLIRAGVDVFRFNFSHGTKETHKLRFDLVRQASKQTGKPVAILQDLQGPKLRVGKFPSGSITIEKGKDVILYLETEPTPVSEKPLIPYNYATLAKEIPAGHRILMDDGNMEVVVTGIEGTQILAQVVFGGVLKDNKGMNFPDTNIKIEAFTPKDKEDLLFGLQLGVDYVALSFVRTAQDIRTVQRFMHSHKINTPVIAKIEKGEAITNLDEILEVTDAVMVARGDLAVEVGTAKVPPLQKKIIAACNTRGIPVITATQMLESMIQTPRPTRAEASDVANAVLDGTDAVMLSAETASGKFPVLTVSVMQGIIQETELQRGSLEQAMPMRTFANEKASIVQAIEHAAAQISTWVQAKAIVCTTHTGQAARALAKYRPRVPILALTDDISVRRALALVWGVDTAPVKPSEDLALLFEAAEKELHARELVDKGDLVIFTAGWPPLKHGTTNLLRVVTIKTEALKKAGEKKQEEILGYRTRRAQFVLDQNLCIQCGGCVEVCPNDIFGIQNRKVYLKEENCKNCTFDNACTEICPTNAIEIIRLND